MTTHTQQDAGAALSAKLRARRRSVTVEVEVDTYVDATIYLDKIPLADLRAELRDRECADRGSVKWNADGDLEDGFAVFSLELAKLEAIRHLYLIGRESEASDRCRALLADMLGTALS